MSPRSLALSVLMGSMTMLFGASVVGYLITRAQNPVWKTAEMPALPRGLWFSTLLIIVVSVAFQRTVSATRRNHLEALERWLWTAAVGAVAFLLMQILNWRTMMNVHGPESVRTLYAFTFYMLTGLHAAHVLGGFVPLGIVLKRARDRKYSSSRYEGIRLCRRYWDYLAVVWIVLLVTMYAAT